MQRMSHWKQTTNASLKKLLAGPVALLLISTLGCQHGIGKRKNEIWLVDGKDLVLYRVISDTKEQTISIKDNPAMNKFMCVDKDEADYWLEESGDE